jgi:hypothetical protein
VALALGLGPARDTFDLFAWHVFGATLFGMVWYATVGRGPLEAATRSWSDLARRTTLLVNRPPAQPPTRAGG